MAAMRETQVLPESPTALALLPETRFEASPVDLPCSPPPYSSIIDDAFMNNSIHLYKDTLRQIALHPVRLLAGQSEPPMGGLGRHAAPVRIPEARGGHIFAGSV